jgi:hypothetical protein
METEAAALARIGLDLDRCPHGFDEELNHGEAEP